MVALEIMALALLFLLDAFYSAAEIAMASLNRYKIAEMAELNPGYAVLLERWKINPNRLLTTILVSSNLVVIAFSSIATALSFSLSQELGVNHVLVGALAMLVSVLAVLLAEIAPKILAKRHPEKVALLVLPGLRVTETLLGPLIHLVVGLIQALTRPFGGGNSTEMPMVTEEELVRIVDEGARDGIIEKEESEMIQSIIQFGDTLVREVMIPRTEMVGLPISATVEDCHTLFIDSGYSRIPVYEGTLDHIKGMIYAKDFLSVLRHRDLIILHDVIRPAFFVPGSNKVANLLREFKKGKIHIAIVVDEYGGTAGLVTLEDLMEEIVGEIRDEYDLDSPQIRRQSEGTWEVDGATELHDLSAKLGVDIPESSDSATVGGFVAELAGRILKKGESLKFQGLEFEVTEASNQRIVTMRVKRVPGN